MNRRVSPAARHRTQCHEEWKESLRRACFDRARKNRKDVIWKRRMEQQQQATHNDDEDDDEIRTVIEQELRQQGVAVAILGSHYPIRNGRASMTSPLETPNCSLEEQEQPQPFLFAATPLVERQESCDSQATEYVISEEELYELLQEVEEEISRSEEELLEEVLEQERCQQREMEDKIAQYEEWEESLAGAASNATAELRVEECVVCPICCEGMLQQSPNEDRTISCPNDACQLYLNSPLQQQQLQQHTHHPNISLAELKERLRLAFEGHSSRCSGTLTFEMQLISDFSDPCRGGCLIGSCQQCNVLLSIT